MESQDGRLLVVDDAAHLANLQQPDAINAAIRAHLAGDATTAEERDR